MTLVVFGTVPMIQQGIPLGHETWSSPGGPAVIADLLQRWRPDPVRRRIEESIRAGTGLSKADWMLSGPAIDSSQIDGLAEEMRDWCRDRIASIRRPYGIDQLALAVACATPGGNPLASTTFGVFRPLDFYNDEGVGDRLEEFLHEVPLASLNVELDAGAPGIRFAAALFSWGDVAREAMFEEDERA